MGWSSGSGLFIDIIRITKNYVPFNRKYFYKEMIEIFERNDWDTQYECLNEDPYFDKALKELHPDWNLEI